MTNELTAPSESKAGAGDVIVPRDVWDWLMGCGDDFECDPADYFRGKAPAFWWRAELSHRVRAAALARAEAAPGDVVHVFRCSDCCVSVESTYLEPDCPECGDPTELDDTAKPARTPATPGAGDAVAWRSRMPGDTRWLLTDHEPTVKGIEKQPLVLPAPAHAAGEDWRSMESAPRDGTMLRLLVRFTENALEDSDDACPTIGCNNFDHDGNDAWQFAGWHWSQDCFTQGEGEPIGWLPMLAAAPRPPVTVEGDASKLRAVIERIKFRLHFMHWPAESMWNAGTETDPKWIEDWRYEIALIENALHGTPITVPEKPTDTIRRNEVPVAAPAASQADDDEPPTCHNCGKQNIMIGCVSCGVSAAATHADIASQPAASQAGEVDSAMVERACVSWFGKGWINPADPDFARAELRSELMDSMRKALTAALAPQPTARVEEVRRTGLPTDTLIDSMQTADALRALCKVLRDEIAAPAASQGGRE